MLVPDGSRLRAGDEQLRVGNVIGLPIEPLWSPVKPPPLAEATYPDDLPNYLFRRKVSNTAFRRYSEPTRLATIQKKK